MIEALQLFLAFAVGLPVIATVIIVALALDYNAKKKGLTKGASQREVQQIRDDIAAIRREVQQLRESQADLTLMLHDLPRWALPKEGVGAKETK